MEHPDNLSIEDIINSRQEEPGPWELVYRHMKVNFFVTIVPIVLVYFSIFFYSVYKSEGTIGDFLRNFVIFAFSIAVFSLIDRLMKFFGAEVMKKLYSGNNDSSASGLHAMIRRQWKDYFRKQHILEENVLLNIKEYVEVKIAQDNYRSLGIGAMGISFFVVVVSKYNSPNQFQFAYASALLFFSALSFYLYLRHALFTTKKKRLTLCMGDIEEMLFNLQISGRTPTHKNEPEMLMIGDVQPPLKLSPLEEERALPLETKNYLSIPVLENGEPS